MRSSRTLWNSLSFPSWFIIICKLCVITHLFSYFLGQFLHPCAVLCVLLCCEGEWPFLFLLHVFKGAILPPIHPPNLPFWGRFLSESAVSTLKTLRCTKKQVRNRICVLSFPTCRQSKDQLRCSDGLCTREAFQMWKALLSVKTSLMKMEKICCSYWNFTYCLYFFCCVTCHINPFAL